MDKTASFIVKFALVLTLVGCKNSGSHAGVISSVTLREKVSASNDPGKPPPPFKLFKQVAGMEPVSFVVSEQTTDEELQNLLWYFRKKIKTQDFHSLGIEAPTTKHTDGYGYQDGSLIVFRTQKCATESFTSVDPPGPCGFGNHSAAEYQWGLPERYTGFKERGLIFGPNQEEERIF